MTSAALGVVLYEGAGSRTLDPTERLGIVSGLLERGYPVSCARGNGNGAAGAVSGASHGTLVVLGRFLEPPPEQALDAAAGVTVHFRDLEGLPPEAAAAAVDDIRSASALPKPGGWKPWFPVIDYARCTNCMQCLSFCLFDVYAVSPEGKIRVQNQTNCKTDCPACSRVCPEVAILFPKYRHGPINGDVVNSDDVRREAMKVDISALLGGDIYSALRDRSERAKSRFSKERDEERALKERLRCLSKLGEAMEIPPEVLAALPTPEEIQARAEAAAERARRALADRPAPGLEPGGTA
jgi:Pyruvate/2-oxoacid:ferredoxin oxidoreductase delta subunit